MALGSLVVEIAANVARFQSDMGKVAQIAESQVKRMDATFGVLSNSLKALGAGAAVGLSLDSIKGKIDGVIKSTADLQQLAERTGASAEALSGLASIAKLSGTDTEVLAGGLQKLSKAMVDAKDGGATTGEAFRAIGVSVKDLKGLKPEEAFSLIAKQLDQYADGAEKTAVAQALLGKSGANLLPMMKDMASAGELQVKATAEQIALADEYDKNLVRLQVAQNGLYRVIAMELLPVMNAFTVAMVESASKTDGMKGAVNGLAQDGSIRTWAEGAAMAAARVVDAFDGVFRVVLLSGKVIGAAVASMNALGEGGGIFSKRGRDAFSNVWSEFGSDADAILSSKLFSDRVREQLEASRKGTTPDGAKPGISYKPNSATEGSSSAKTVLAGAIKAQEDAIAMEKRVLQSREQAIDGIRSQEYISLREAEERKRAVIRESLDSTLAAYDREAAAIRDFMGKGGLKPQDRIDGENKLAEVAAKRAAAEEEASKKQVESQLRVLAVQRQFDMATQEKARQDQIAAANAQFEVDMLGKGTLEVQKANSARQIQLALEERIYQLRKLDPTADTTKAVEEAAQQTVRMNAIIEAGYNKSRSATFGANEAMRKYGEDAVNIGAGVENALTSAFKGMEDALVTFVTTGKLSFKSLADAIVADITRIIIKQQISNAMGLAGGGGVGGIIGSFLGMLMPGSGGASASGTSSIYSLSSGDSGLGLKLPGRASGGPVGAGTAYMVGESGPELFVPRVSGAVVPNGGVLGGGGSTVVQVNVTPPAGSSRETAAQWGAQVGRHIQHSMRRNG